MVVTLKKITKILFYPPYYFLKIVTPNTAQRLRNLFRKNKAIKTSKEKIMSPGDLRDNFLTLSKKISHIEEEIQQCVELQCIASIKINQPSFKIINHLEPIFEKPVSQLATTKQFHSPKFSYWCKELREPFKMHRKIWEYAYVLQVLEHFDILKKGNHGLGFGVGSEQLPALFAKYGCYVVATDQDSDMAEDEGWIKTDQFSLDKNRLNAKGICDPEQFNKLVDFKTVDMKNIPSDLRNFDFIWSCCSLEHLGNLHEGLAFIKNSIVCLKPGGIAIHTTEFNLSSNTSTVTDGPTVIYRRQDIVKLMIELVQLGCEVSDINFNPGSLPIDRHIDFPPYNFNQHVKLHLMGYTSTSIGIVIKKLPGVAT